MFSSLRIPKPLLALYFLLILQSLGLFAAFVYAVNTTDLRFGGDFITFWLRGVAVVQGQLAQVYDMSVFNYVPESAGAGAKHIYTVFPYPPNFLLYLWPLGLVSYGVAMAGWLAITAALYFTAVFQSPEWHKFKHVRVPEKRLLAVFVLLSPFVISNLFTAQTGYLSGALLIAGLSLLDRRPYLAGVCIGLLCFKPQLGIMLPFALLAGRYYQSFLAAAATAVLTLTLPWLIWGWELWAQYPAYVSAFTDLVARLPALVVGLYCSLFHYMRLAAPLPLAIGLQLVLGGIAIATVWRAFSSHTHKEYRTSILICATFLAAPHTMAYDMTLFIIPVLYLTHRIAQGRESALALIPLVALLALLPLNLDTLNKAGFPAAFLVVTALFILLVTHFKGGKKR